MLSFNELDLLVVLSLFVSFRQKKKIPVDVPLQIWQEVHFWQQSVPKQGLCRRVEGGEVHKVNFLGPKGPLLGVPHPSRFDPGCGPGVGHSVYNCKMTKKIYKVTVISLHFISRQSNAYTQDGLLLHDVLSLIYTVATAQNWQNLQ